MDVSVPDRAKYGTAQFRVGRFPARYLPGSGTRARTEVGMVHLFIEGTVADGKVEELEGVIAKLAEEVRSHDGVEMYEFYVDADRKTFIGHERYRDAAALGGHAEALGPDGLSGLMGALAGPPAITVLGELPDALREVFAGMGARFTTSIGGFTR